MRTKLLSQGLKVFIYFEFGLNAHKTENKRLKCYCPFFCFALFCFLLLITSSNSEIVDDYWKKPLNHKLHTHLRLFHEARSIRQFLPSVFLKEK